MMHSGGSRGFIRIVKKGMAVYQMSVHRNTYLRYIGKGALRALIRILKEGIEAYLQSVGQNTYLWCS